MTIVEFAEALYGRRLSVYQKKLLECMATLPKNSEIVYGRHGKIYFVDKGENNDKN